MYRNNTYRQQIRLELWRLVREHIRSHNSQNTIVWKRVIETKELAETLRHVREDIRSSMDASCLGRHS